MVEEQGRLFHQDQLALLGTIMKDVLHCLDTTSEVLHTSDGLLPWVITVSQSPSLPSCLSAQVRDFPADRTGVGVGYGRRGVEELCSYERSMALFRAFFDHSPDGREGGE